MNEYNLGSKITENSHCAEETMRKINQVKCAFQSKKNIFVSRNIDMEVREKPAKRLMFGALYAEVRRGS